MTQESRLPAQVLFSLEGRIREEIQSRTNGAIRGLEVEVLEDSVVLSGRTTRYYYKQLATCAVLEQADAARMRLENGIAVLSE